MKIKASNPATVAAPASHYAQVVDVRDATRWLVISGQIGVTPDGKLAGDPRAQVRQCFANIIEVLHANDMKLENLVKITVFLTNSDDMPAFREVRDEMLAGHLCASTLLVISALARPELAVEIEATAAA